MTNYYALWSIVFGIGFVFLFDGIHRRNRLGRMLRSLRLLNKDELDRLSAIWSACQDA